MTKLCDDNMLLFTYELSCFYISVSALCETLECVKICGNSIFHLTTRFYSHLQSDISNIDCHILYKQDFHLCILNYACILE